MPRRTLNFSAVDIDTDDDDELFSFDPNTYQPPKLDRDYYNALLIAAEKERLQQRQLATVNVLRRIYGTKLDADEPMVHAGIELLGDALMLEQSLMPRLETSESPIYH